MKEEWLERLKRIRHEIEESEDGEMELVEEHLSVTIDELDSLI